MFRFFVDKKIDNTFKLSKETIKHIQVARVANEEFICVYKEKFYACRLNGNFASIIRIIDADHEHKGEVIIAAAIINTKRFEWLIQKASELGATKLMPVLSNNISQKLGNDINKKVSRWNGIALNASEQSFRNKQMIVDIPRTFDEVINLNVENKYIAHEKVNAKVPISFPTDTLFLVGPEGGFTDDEVLKANDNGFETVSLGKRILRAETASIFMLTRIN